MKKEVRALEVSRMFYCSLEVCLFCRRLRGQREWSVTWMLWWMPATCAVLAASCLGKSKQLTFNCPGSHCASTGLSCLADKFINYPSDLVLIKVSTFLASPLGPSWCLKKVIFLHLTPTEIWLDLRIIEFHGHMLPYLHLCRVCVASVPSHISCSRGFLPMAGLGMENNDPSHD